MIEKIYECVSLIEGADPLIEGFLWGNIPPFMENDY